MMSHMNQKYKVKNLPKYIKDMKRSLNFLFIPLIQKMGEEISDSESVVAIGEEELALLIKTSIQTLKRKKKKCGRKEVFNLVNESIEYKISLETFNETLNSLIENETVTLNRECISLPK